MQCSESELNNEHFHHKDKGCKLRKKNYMETSYGGEIRGKHCSTHKTDICFCGWEWGWHGGTNNRNNN